VLFARTFLLKEVTSDFKIIIADNGSTDQTGDIATKLSNEFKEVEYIKVSKKGVGLALRTSWQKSKSDIVGYMDLDLATDLKHLKEVYQIFSDDNKNIEIINGSRLLYDSVVKNRTPLRTFTSKSFNKIVKKSLGTNFTDGMCGFKFFKAQTAKELINTGIVTDGWFFSTEILVKAEWMNKRIHELAISWEDDNNSKVKVIKLSQEYLKQIQRLKKEKNDFITKYV
jgi:glycosyltransferase involved in cell wall biosynthesis